MSCWFLSIVHVISTCSATKILYVLPDNVSDVNCPSQSCATLDQYLLDNGSLPVSSDVEYYFLPGEHHVVSIINMYDAFNFSLIGFGLSPAKLICKPQSYIGMFFSYNVSIKNLVFNQCSGDFGSKYMGGGLILYECSHCKVDNVIFFGYGFEGVNLYLNSSVNNITIDMTTIVRSTVNMCSPRFVLKFINVEDNYNYVLINQVFISGYNELCPEDYALMNIHVDHSYDMHVELCNIQFYNVTQSALFIKMEYTTGSLLIKNSTFTYIVRKSEPIYTIFTCEVPDNNVTIMFENCAFYYNVAINILLLVFDVYYYHDDWCAHPSNVTIENCDFIGNNGVLINSDSGYCMVNIFLNNFINFTKNIADVLIGFVNMDVRINGTVTLLENEVKKEIIAFQSCEIAFTKTITFMSNICEIVVYMTSFDIQYIKLIEFANITLINNTYHELFITGPVADSYIGIFPYCIFQYMIFASNTPNISELLALYAISLSGSKQLKTVPFCNSKSAIQMISVYDFLTHCKWLPNAVFNGYDPGYINQQIIQVDGHQWIYHKQICYCPHDGPYDCTVDLLGPVYPGQRLQVELCMPQAEADEDYFLRVETHSASLPNSACKLAHQTEFINSIRNHSKIFNFTIISESESCDLFLTVQPFVRAAFYVKLLPCPVGFTLQNGKCDCDPFLPPETDTCYIDLSAIRRPANTWITAHTLTNNTTKYLISDCPMDYCIPYSTNVNLVHPDLQCQFNRTGILCSQCPHPLSMVLGSSRCMQCTNVHILITIIVIVAGIVLVVLLYVLNLTVTNGAINGIIFYANIVSINDSVFLVNDNVFKPLRVFISFTNLDLGIETCFYNGMDSYVKMWLQLFFPSYLIIIAVSIIIASRYSSRILRLTYSRSLPVLATLFLLSYTGVLRVVLTVLFSYSTITHYPSGDKQILWSIDASVPLFGSKFTILFITCLVLFSILIVFNITLLFTRYLSRFRIVNHCKPLLDAFQGSYKDKYHYWVAVHMMFRSIFFSLYAFQVKLSLILATIILVIFTGYYGYLRPNKNKIINFQELSILVNLTVMYAVSIQESEKIFSVVTNVTMTLALLQFNIIVLGHFVVYTCHCKFSIKEKLTMLFKKRKSNHHSFDVALLDIPERTYNYSEYQDGLVSDDFKSCK